MTACKSLLTAIVLVAVTAGPVLVEPVRPAEPVRPIAPMIASMPALADSMLAIDAVTLAQEAHLLAGARHSLLAESMFLADEAVGERGRKHREHEIDVTVVQVSPRGADSVGDDRSIHVPGLSW